MTSDTNDRTIDPAAVSPAAAMRAWADRPIARRRRFTPDDKRHLLELAKRSGSSISDVAQRYDVPVSQLFRWRKELEGGAETFAGFVPVDIVDEPQTATQDGGVLGGPAASTPAQQSSSAAVEIELKNGKRLRVEAGADPEAIRRLVTLLEGAAP